MLKKILLTGLVLSNLNAQTYTSTLESDKFVSMKSEVSGKVKNVYNLEDTLFLNEEKIVIRIDDSLENDKLDILSTNIEYLLQIDKENDKLLKLEKKILNNTRKDNNFKLQSDSYSNNQKLLLENANFKSEKSYILENERRINSKISLNNLRKDIKTLQNIIQKKNIKLKKSYIYKIHVVPGEVIQKGQKLFDYYDLTNLQLTYFVTEEDFKKIQLNGIKAINVSKNNDNIKIKDYKLFKIKDNTHLGSYKLEIVVYDKLVDKIGFLFDLEVK